MIPVTKPYLPSKSLYKEYVDKIYSNNWLTNNGPFVREYELALKEYLNLNSLLFVGNGTIAIQFAIKALDLKGEIITTPFSYIATTSSIVWEGCKPVFVDIDAETFNIDATKIEKAINNNTSAILATHCFGNACDIEMIESIAQKHHLKVIYDAAHCFGSLYKGKSIFEFGDISTCSLHATKLVHSVEGGFVSTNSNELLSKLGFMRNFGHNGPSKFKGIGINGKNSEFHAAMGLSVLKDAEIILNRRKSQYLYYQENIVNECLTLKVQKKSTFNYAYFPILFENEELMLRCLKVLEKNNIYPRRYFHPSLSSLDYVEKYKTPISDSVSSRIMCLPLYFELTKVEQDLILNLISKAICG